MKPQSNEDTDFFFRDTLFSRSYHMDQLDRIVNLLKDDDKDAWIITDYENHNPILVSILGKRMLTRKIFMAITKEGKPYLICHKIDTVFLSDEETKKNFDLLVYKTWDEMLEIEKKAFSSYKKVYMDVSENGLLPRISLADYGSVEYIKSLGVEIYSSQDLMQTLYATFSEEQERTQLEAISFLLKIKDEAFKLIKEDILDHGYSDEYRIQKHLTDRMKEEGFYYDDAPIVAINHNASDPHYGPTENVHSTIKEGDVVLMDLWCKKDKEVSIYGDITWMGYVGSEVPTTVKERFSILRKAVDSGFELIEKKAKSGISGYEVDDEVRRVVKEAGYGEYFIHRTGHSIAYDDSPHGPGANIDNYESHDTRRLIPNTSFSLEPGIYAPDFGMRLETDVYIDNDFVPHMVGGRQEEVIAIMKL